MGRFGLKIAMCPIFMKCGTQHKSNMLIINMLIEILMTLTQNYKFAKFGLKTEMCSNFYEIWHLEQMEHASCEYSTWNWWSWSKIIYPGKFGPKIKMCSNFHEIWHSGHFKISFNKVTNFIKGLRNVKTLESFFSRGVLCTQ